MHISRYNILICKQACNCNILYLESTKGAFDTLIVVCYLRAGKITTWGDKLKEKIERFSKGDFEYELPFICLTEEEIRITVEAGKIYEGSFIISSSAEGEMKGMVYSSNRLLQIKTPFFLGAVNTVIYSFDASFLKAGEAVQGEVCIVSDSGEKTLPFYVQVEMACVITSLGKIKDLFQFTNLARMDWSEAKKIFKQEDFETIFLSNEERYRYIYRYLMKSLSTSQALEEFLIAIHKKAMIRLTVDRTLVDYVLTEEGIADKLILTKDHWGYAEIRVSTDAEFIQPEQKFLWADRFIGNTNQIAYTIDPKFLRAGMNTGYIWIKTAYQTITIQINCKYIQEKNRLPEQRLRQKLEFGMVDNYLSFRLDRIDLMRYIEETETILHELPETPNSIFKELVKTHLTVIAGKTKLAEELLGDFALSDALIKRRSVFEYCAYLYLKALYHKDEETIKDTAETIRYYYENGNPDWRILWFLLNLDSGYSKAASRKLQDIIEQFEIGSHNPILYYEAVGIFNEEPVLLRELNDFEIQVMNYGIKNWIISKELARQYTYLANKRKGFHPVIYQGLVKLYDEFEDPEILSAICCTLIKGGKRAEKYFEWYRLGVEAQLRITELYEYYMYSVSPKMEEVLAQPVLLYFIYNSNLSDTKKAFLYANIVKNKDQNESIYRTYFKRMEIFASKMLETHQISWDLAVLYKEFLNKNSLSAELSKHLPYVLYRQELCCDNPNMVSVIVLHKELGVEESEVLTKGHAQIDVFTSNAEIFLIDSYGNRYVESVDYTITPFLSAEEYENQCLEYSNHTMLLLHLFDRYQSYRIMNERAIALRKQVLQIEGLSQEYVTECYQALIEYYFENYHDEQLELYLNQIDLHTLKPMDRTRYLEYMVTRSLYTKAMEALQTFGFEGITINRLVKMCSGWMLTDEAELKNEMMVDLCYYVFSYGKYDEAILRYLVNYYNGATREMFKLWKAAKSFEINTHMLEERLLTQMLFTESYLEESFRVFGEYYKDVTNHILVRAFLSFYAYNYLVHLHVIHSELFPIMKRELNYEENDICLLAWLKQNTTNRKLTESELSFIELMIDHLVKKGIILPFFLEYRKLVALPERITDRCYITYITDPKKQVYIHYRLLKPNDQEYTTQRMSNAFMGIHVKEFVLFYHEALQYYITEEASDGSNITESLHTQYDCETPEEDDSKYNQINLMLMTLEVKEDNTLLELMDNYVKRKYLIDACFRQID